MIYRKLRALPLSSLSSTTRRDNASPSSRTLPPITPRDKSKAFLHQRTISRSTKRKKNQVSRLVKYVHHSSIAHLQAALPPSPLLPSGISILRILSHAACHVSSHKVMPPSLFLSSILLFPVPLPLVLCQRQLVPELASLPSFSFISSQVGEACLTTPPLKAISLTMGIPETQCRYSTCDSYTCQITLNLSPFVTLSSSPSPPRGFFNKVSRLPHNSSITATCTACPSNLSRVNKHQCLCRTHTSGN